MLNLSFILEESAISVPNRVAFKYESTAITFLQANAMANQVANGLVKLGIKKGDKVILDCINLPYFPIIYYGILKMGAIVVPVNVMLKTPELVYHILNSDAKAFFCFTGTPELPMIKYAHEAFKDQDVKNICKYLIEITPQPADAPVYKEENILTLGQIMHQQSPIFETVNTATDDTAVILYTSGTTGKPKGAELSHFNLFSNAWHAADIFNYKQDDVSLIALPLFHSFAQTVQLNAAIKSGATSILVAKFLPKTVLHKIQQENVSIFCGVPTMYWALTQAAQDPEIKEILPLISKRLRICCSGGAALAVEDLKNFEETFHVQILEGYGLSEASPVVCFNRPLMPRKVGSIGVAIPHVHIKVVNAIGEKLAFGEVGELMLKGPNVMKGYYKNREETEKTLKNSWLYTGDLAKIDQENYVYIVDRSKDMIIKSGFNIYPREIEEVILTCPLVAQVAVIGIPAGSHGEEVKAFIVLKPEKLLLTQEDRHLKKEILDFLKERIASYKMPKEIEFRTELPMNATGKILKNQLRLEHQD